MNADDRELIVARIAEAMPRQHLPRIDGRAFGERGGSENLALEVFDLVKRALATSDKGSRFTLPARMRSLPPVTASAIAPSGGVMARSASPQRTAAVAFSTLPMRLSVTLKR